MLNNEELELISFMDYQVANNGMVGWLGNKGYERIFEFIELLQRRNSDIDKKVIVIFQKVTIAGLKLFQHEHAIFIPEVLEIVTESYDILKECTDEYFELVKEFMESYDLEDYLTTFSKNLKNSEE